MAAPPPACQCRDCGYYSQGSYYNPSPYDHNQHHQQQQQMQQYQNHPPPPPQTQMPPNPHQQQHQQVYSTSPLNSYHQPQHHQYYSPSHPQQQQHPQSAYQHPPPTNNQTTSEQHQYYYANQPPLPAPVAPQPPPQQQQHVQTPPSHHASPVNNNISSSHVGGQAGCACLDCNNHQMQPYPSDPYQQQQTNHYQQQPPPPPHQPYDYQAQQQTYQQYQPQYNHAQLGSIKPESAAAAAEATQYQANHETQQYRSEPTPPEPTGKTTKQKRGPRAGSKAKKDQLKEGAKESAYGRFYKIMKQQLPPHVNFSEVSKIISDAWKALSEEEKAVYVKDCSENRKKRARNKANKQAMDLLKPVEIES